jgi:hypothetical protein
MHRAEAECLPMYVRTSEEPLAGSLVVAELWPNRGCGLARRQTIRTHHNGVNHWKLRDGFATLWEGTSGVFHGNGPSRSAIRGGRSRMCLQ